MSLDYAPNIILPNDLTLEFDDAALEELEWRLITAHALADVLARLSCPEASPPGDDGAGPDLPNRGLSRVGLGRRPGRPTRPAVPGGAEGQRMNAQILPALPEPQPLMEVGRYPPEKHPVLAYLERSNNPLSRENMVRRLNIVARLLTHDTTDAMHFPWHNMTDVMTLSVRATLMETHAPQTVNTTLAAVKSVLRECWRFGYISAEEMARATAVPAVKGTRLPTGRALEVSELRQLLHSCQHARRRALDARDAALLGLLLGLGLRTSEAVSVNLEGYDPAAGTVRVLHAKGNRQREMPVPPPAAEVLQAWTPPAASGPGRSHVRAPIMIGCNRGAW